jgi:DNA recombination protein RmuC
MVGTVLAILGGAALIALAVFLGLRSRTPPAPPLPPPGPDVGAELERLRKALLEAQSLQRQELGGALAQLQQGLSTSVAQSQQTQTAALAQHLGQLASTVDTRLKHLQAENSGKLDEMRKTVDEKLQNTLEQRLGQSFKQVSDWLEQLNKGLGEMRSLAIGVGDLKRLMGNVKTRGILAEGHLQTLLEQVLTPEQFARNVATRAGSAERVEFAIKVPGGIDGQPCWLPIDAKFPREDYERLQDAQDRADPLAAEAAGLALERRIRLEAQSIHDKYIEPPLTTDFAILFLPTEGLYAEVLRRPGLFEALQREFHVSVAGPTNLLAILNSLQMGFRTLAIEKRSSEVWQVLGAVKTEFGKFGMVLEKVGEKLDQARKQIDETGVRRRAIEKRLRGVEALPEAEAAGMLPAPESTEADER